MKKILLHICCGVCALYCVEKLKAGSWLVEGFFYNPNIYPAQEYYRRADMMKIISEHCGIIIHEGQYDAERWIDFCRGKENEPEGGNRCLLCYRLRLEKAFEKSKELECGAFTTTLTISPHKKSAIVFEIGRQIAGDKFLPVDFKKQNGFIKTNALAKELEIYRQTYCGCRYSLI